MPVLFSFIQCHHDHRKNGQVDVGTQNIYNSGVNHMTFVVESRCQLGTYFEKSMVSG